VDLSNYFIVVIYQGDKPSTGYSVEVNDVKREGTAIIVDAVFHEPAPDEAKGAAMTSPYYVLKVRKTEGLEGPFTFVLIVNGQEIVRQMHTIP